jgi:hypothetical protein
MTRLRLARHVGHGTLDGGWWPRSRDLTTELTELAGDLAPELGTLDRVELSAADWDGLPPAVELPPGTVAATTFSHEEETHRIDLHLSGGTTLRLLVVPPAMTADQGEEALLAAATPGYEHTAASLLDTVSEYPDVDPRDQWRDGPAQ